MNNKIIFNHGIYDVYVNGKIIFKTPWRQKAEEKLDSLHYSIHYSNLFDIDIDTHEMLKRIEKQVDFKKIKVSNIVRCAIKFEQ